MRTLIRAAIATTILLTIGEPASADSGGCVRSSLGSISCGFSGGSSSSGSSGGSSAGGSGSSVPSLTTPHRQINADGSTCVVLITTTHASGIPAAAQAVSTDLWGLLAGSTRCVGADAIQVIDPSALAWAFWREVTLPSPAPAIDPGWAITGKPAYLETGGVLRKTFTRATPIGTLTITAIGRFRVWWGDGATSGPFANVGGPWPDGRITHTYTDTGRYDVVVDEDWTARWRLAGFSGSLSSLRTSGTIANFVVREIQAVRNR